MVEEALITVLCGGHALLIPGPAETKRVGSTAAASVHACLIPSDFVGSEVLEESPGGKRSFRFIPGQLMD